MDNPIAIQNAFADEWKKQWIAYLTFYMDDTNADEIDLHKARYVLQDIDLCVYAKVPRVTNYMKRRISTYLAGLADISHDTKQFNIYIVDENANSYFILLDYRHRAMRKQFEQHICVAHNSFTHLKHIADFPDDYGCVDDRIVFIRHKTAILLLLTIYECYYEPTCETRDNPKMCLLQAIDLIFADNYILRCIGKY